MLPSPQNFWKDFLEGAQHLFILIAYDKLHVHRSIRGKLKKEQLPCELFLQQIEISRAFLTPISHGKSAANFNLLQKLLIRQLFLFRFASNIEHMENADISSFSNLLDIGSYSKAREWKLHAIPLDDNLTMQVSVFASQRLC